MQRIKPILILLLILSLLLGGCSSASQGSSEAGSQGTTGAVQPATTQAIPFVQSGDLNEAALRTANFSFTKGEILYLLALYSTDLSYYGVDMTSSLKEQAYPGEEGVSWFQVLMDEVKGYAQDQLELCEAAKARGFVLDEEDNKAIAELKDLAAEYAATMGWDLDTYFSQVYGTNLGWAQIEGVLTKSRLVQKLQLEITSKTYTDEDLDAEFYEDIRRFAVVDYYPIDLGNGEDVSEELLTKTKEDLQAADSLEAFKAALKDYLTAVKPAADIEAAGGADAYTEQTLSKAYRKGIAYSSSAFSEWAYGKEAKDGDVFVTDNAQTKTTYVYYLVRAPHKDESVLVDVRHILFKTPSPYATAEEARAKAEEIYNDWVKQGASEDKFIELCAEYSADGTASSGGLYTDVEAGQMVATFNDWCFDESRQTGDHGIVDTEYGSHIMYFVDRHVSWKQQVLDSIWSAEQADVIAQQTPLTPCEILDGVLDSIVW